MRGDFGGSSVNDSFPSGFPRPLLSGSSRCGSVSCRRRSPRRASRPVTFGALPAAKAAAPSRGPEDGHESDRSPAAWHPRRRHRVPPGVKYRPSGHCEGLLGLKVDDPGVTAFTAIIQVGAILAVIIYFRSDIGRLASAWLRGLVNGKTREAPDYRFAWYVILGLIPIGIVRLSSPRPDLGASAQLCGSRWWWRSWAGAR